MLDTAAVRRLPRTRWSPSRFALLAVLLAGSLPPALARQAEAQAAPSTAEDSVRSLELARRTALLAADTVALSRMIAPEFVEISRLGTLRDRQSNLQDIATGVLALSAVRFDSLAVTIYGETALLRGIAENAGRYRGFPFAGRVRYLRVFVRRDGRWQAVAMSQTPVP